MSALMAEIPTTATDATPVSRAIPVGMPGTATSSATPASSPFLRDHQAGLKAWRTNECPSRHDRVNPKQPQGGSVPWGEGGATSSHTVAAGMNVRVANAEMRSRDDRQRLTWSSVHSSNRRRRTRK